MLRFFLGGGLVVHLIHVQSWQCRLALKTGISVCLSLCPIVYRSHALSCGDLQDKKEKNHLSGQHQVQDIVTLKFSCTQSIRLSVKGDRVNLNLSMIGKLQKVGHGRLVHSFFMTSLQIFLLSKISVHAQFKYHVKFYARCTCLWIILGNQCFRGIQRGRQLSRNQIIYCKSYWIWNAFIWA